MPSDCIYTLPLPYVYKITNKETGEFYIGSRYGNVRLQTSPENDLLVIYFTSGALELALRENSENYSHEILFRHGEGRVAYWYEQLLIKEHIDNPLCLNKSYYDPDTCLIAFSVAGNVSHKKGQLLSEETKLKMSLAKTGKIQTEQHNKNISLGVSKYLTGRPSNIKGYKYPAQVCPHCNKEGGGGRFKLYHFDNCKSK